MSNRLKLNVKSARINSGIKQSAAAKSLGIPISMLSFMERGYVFPSEPLQEKICKLYGVPKNCINFYDETLLAKDNLYTR